MFLDADDSSEGISRSELERFWGKELTGLTIAQRKVVIELYRKSRQQAISTTETEAALRNIASGEPQSTESTGSKLP
jgi:hypothetical protein